MSQGMHAGGNVFSAYRVALDRVGADQEAVERPFDPKVIRREIAAGFLRAVLIGIGGDHRLFLAPNSTPTRRRATQPIRGRRLCWSQPLRRQWWQSTPSERLFG